MDHASAGLPREAQPAPHVPEGAPRSWMGSCRAVMFFAGRKAGWAGSERRKEGSAGFPTDTIAVGETQADEACGAGPGYE